MMTPCLTSALSVAEPCLTDDYIQLDFEPLEQLVCELQPAAEAADTERLAA